ncbi:MAG: hypothetical protein DRG25_03965 [Deltaproteobacteria bacterium]|nr:MAG: hypothetical protein DRG25_03965 [Deltaproteobacteria bacterium]
MSHSLKEMALFWFTFVLVLMPADPSHAELSFKVRRAFGSLYLRDEGKIILFDRGSKIYLGCPGKLSLTNTSRNAKYYEGMSGVELN